MNAIGNARKRREALPFRMKKVQENQGFQDTYLGQDDIMVVLPRKYVLSPIFIADTHEDDKMFGFTVRFYRHCGDGWNQGLIANLERHDTQDGTQSDSQAAISAKLIAMIRENRKATRKQMAETLSVSTSTVQRLLKDLPNVHFVGSGYSGHWEIDDTEL